MYPIRACDECGADALYSKCPDCLKKVFKKALDEAGRKAPARQAAFDKIMTRLREERMEQE